MSGDTIAVEGVILDEQRGGLFRVEALVGTARREVLAKASGRLIQHRIRIVAGDLVTVELSPYDLSRGRITHRGRREERAT